MADSDPPFSDPAKPPVESERGLAQTPPMEQFDVLVIGSGPAGHHAAIQAAKVGRKVAICERRDVVGGVCINTGTIPSKTFREAVLYLIGYQQRGLYGPAYRVKAEITIDDLLFRCNHVIRREIEVNRVQLERNGVQLISGAAAFRDPHVVKLIGPAGTTDIGAEIVIIAAGTMPRLPEDLPTDGEQVISSDDILDLKRLPTSLTVIGAGVIGTEYASMFAALGIPVTIIDDRERLLPFVDAEMIESLSHEMRRNHCTMRLGEEIAAITMGPSGQPEVHLESGKCIASDLILYARGRQGASAALNLAAAGLAADERGRIAVSKNYQTIVPHIYAVGDIIGFPALASTSMEQGRLAAAHAVGIKATSAAHLFPYGIYSVPEISMVGKNEEELTAAQVPYEIGISRYGEIARGQILGDASGLLKLLFHAETRQLLGVHIIGTGATELVHIGQAIMAFDGTLDYFLHHVFNYPTFAECYKVAALDALNRFGYGGW